MNDLAPKTRTRAVHSRRAAIRREIERRIAAGESLAIRAVILAVGGGSTDTVREELAQLTAVDVRIAGVGHSMRNPGEQIVTLRAALDASLQREAALTAELGGLRALLEKVDGTMAYVASRHDDTFRQMLLAVDHFRVAAKNAETRTGTAPPTQSSSKAEPDLVLEGKYRLQVLENVRLLSRVRELEERIAALDLLRPALFPTCRPKPFEVETVSVSRTARGVTRTRRSAGRIRYGILVGGERQGASGS